MRAMTETTSPEGVSEPGVPVIDIADLAARRTRAAIDAACRDWGIFQVINHGVAQDTLLALLEEQRRFFALPQGDKLRIERTADNPWGFYNRELTKNTPDWKEIFDVGQATGTEQPQWPAHRAEFRRCVGAADAAMQALARRLLAVLAENLGEPAAALHDSFTAHTSFLRLNFYPTCATPARADSPTVPDAGRLGIGHHTDAGALTVLVQDDQPGLQVLHNERWHTVEARADALVINLGDIAQVWSNDAYQAPLHRVLANATHTRCSTAFFFNPSYDATYAPLPSQCINQKPRYQRISWRDFRAQRSAGDYADHGAEVQISDYRTG